jgi:uncharacterized YigZ family protein
MSEFITILTDELAEIVEKKSKFIANIYHVESVKEAEEKIKLVKKEYHDARHNCVAYRVVENGKITERSSDDGEPSGTAGGPMLNILQKSNLCNVVVIVTRYFGGVLLGTGGLVRAYSDATQKAIEKCIKVYKAEGLEIEVKLDYAYLDIFKHYCKNNEINIIKIDYAEDIVLKIQMEKNRKNIFMKNIETKTLNLKSYQLIQEILIDKTVEKNK